MGHAERACAACGREPRASEILRILRSSVVTRGTEIRPAVCFATPVVVVAAPWRRRRLAGICALHPKHLMDRIPTSRGAERKQVTVFLPTTGSMELAEQVDPEEWHRILDRFFEILTEGVHRFEGTVNQYTGDGVMALFGAPLAHEDHAHRACYAALHLGEELRRFAQELKRERGLTFATRMGLNSGEVVVGTIGDDLRMDYTAQGQVVGIAARLQTLADPGKAYVSEHTAALVEGFFALGSLGASLEGRHGAVSRFRSMALAACARGQTSRPAACLASGSSRRDRRARGSAGTGDRQVVIVAEAAPQEPVLRGAR
jgi:class 3 adenylate cyclase